MIHEHPTYGLVMYRLICLPLGRTYVLQASFDPPGITVSVKKDRAMEPLLQVSQEWVQQSVIGAVTAGTGTSIFSHCCSNAINAMHHVSNHV